MTLKHGILWLGLILGVVSMAEAEAPAGKVRRGKPPAPKAAAGKASILPFKATERTLPNGLKVIVVPTGFPNLVSIQIPVQTGSRNEVEPGKSGFAHFFEHMMFRGTPSYSPEKYQAVMTAAGARNNAYTTNDYTNYHVTFAKEDLETIIKVEADQFQNLAYEESAFKTESRAVLGEYNKNSANPLRKLLEIQRDHAFAVHTYKHTTMGFLKDIEDMPNQFAYSKEFFSRWYRPEYTTVMLVGDVTPAEVFPLVEKYWGGWKRGSFTAKVPVEPPAKGPVYAHVEWPSTTLPWVTVAFHGPAFSETAKDFAALDTLLDLTFGDTSALRKRLVEDEQKVDQMFSDYDANVDPSMFTVFARVKKIEDAVDVRDQILKAFAAAGEEGVARQRLEDAKANARYAFARSLNNTETIASILARFVRFRRSYDTLNNLYGVYESLTREDLQNVARTYVTDANLVVTTLSQAAMPAEMTRLPKLASLLAPPAPAAAPDLPVLVQRSPLPVVEFKLVFAAGSTHDPRGKEGLAAVTAAMVTDAGSKAQRIDEIRKLLYPMAGRFDAQVDKELLTLTGIVHKDNWKAFLDVALPMLLDPGLREDDFKRVKDQQLNALTQDLRENNEEELGKERLQAELFAGSGYGHPAAGTVAGLQAVTLDDVRAFLAARLARAHLSIGVSGDVPEEMLARLKQELGRLPAGAAAAAGDVVARKPKGLEVDIVKKETRATAISFGHPIEVTRSHPDFAALSVARTWLGEHRSTQARLFQRIRELRGMNYGDYAYIEAFPRGMFQFFPDASLVRKQQIFEVWIRPVMPENGPMALRIALHELRELIDKGLSQEDFEATRHYLMKNVFLLTASQDHQLGYALDSKWYGIGEFTSTMRERLKSLTREQVNAAIKRHLSGTDLKIVIITKDAEGLKQTLLADTPSTIKYDAPKPPEILEEDKRIGALKLGLAPEAVKITPIEEVFGK
jgi:zinc protease